MEFNFIILFCQEIVAQLEDLQSEWSHLVDTSAIKRTRLNEANSALVYFHSIEEFEGSTFFLNFLVNFVLLNMILWGLIDNVIVSIQR